MLIKNLERNQNYMIHFFNLKLNIDGFVKSLVYGKSSTKRVLISRNYKIRLLNHGLFAISSIF
jgi:hypothetical protein